MWEVSMDPEEVDSYYSIATFIGFTIIGLIIAIYVMNWVLFASLRQWLNIAPKSLKNSIKLISIGLMIILISGAVTAISDELETIASLVSIAGIIVQFIGIVQLRNAKEMPEIGRNGASGIMWGIITSWITGLLAVIIMVAGSVIIMSEYNAIYGHIDDEDVLMYAFIHSGYYGYTLLIALIGWIISTYLTYNGWRLIGKSELPVLSEPTEELSCEDVTEASEQKCDIAE
jgi:cytochrome b561